MKHKSGSWKIRIRFVVGCVSENGTAKIFHMNADLMSAAGLKAHTDQGIISVAGNAVVKCAGELAFVCVGDSLKAVAVFRVADNLSAYVSCACRRTAAADADVFFLKRFIVELLL